MTIEIVKANYLRDYTIGLEFSDGIVQVIDFEHFLSSAANNMTKKYLDKSLFKNFNIQYGDIVWNDYELCFPIWDLHQGKL
jgi:hypothetical protein